MASRGLSLPAYPDPKTLPEALCCRYITFGEHFDTFSLQEFYTRYCDSIEAATKIFRGRRVFTSCQISFTDWCLSLSKGNSPEKTTYLTKLRPLLHPKHAETLETLATYLLDANSEIKRPPNYCTSIAIPFSTACRKSGSSSSWMRQHSPTVIPYTLLRHCIEFRRRTGNPVLTTISPPSSQHWTISSRWSSR